MAVGYVIGLAGLVTRIASNLTNKKDDDIEAARSVVDTLQSMYGSVSTTSAAQSASKVLIAPVVLFEDTLMHHEQINNIMIMINLRDVLNVTTHFKLKPKFGNISVGELVGEVNPNRVSGMMALSSSSGLEAYDAPKLKVESNTSENKDSSKDPVFCINNKKTIDLKEVPNLVVGRVIDVTISNGVETVDIPLIFRQTPLPVPAEGIKVMFGNVKNEDGWKARVLMKKSGEITNPDLMGGDDIIKREFKTLTSDIGAYYKESNDRFTRNTIEGFRTGIHSMNKIANSIIISQDTARDIETKYGFTFGGSRMGDIRKVVKANNIVIIDDGASTVTLYSLSGAMAETFTFKMLENMVKKEQSVDYKGLLQLFNGR